MLGCATALRSLSRDVAAYPDGLEALAPAFRRGAIMKAALLEMEGGVFTEAEFAARVRMTLQDLDRKTKAGEILAVEVDGRRRYPVFQVAGHGLLPGLARALHAFECSDPWDQLNFFLTGDARLGGRRPLDVLRDGDVDSVVSAARGYGEHGG